MKEKELRIQQALGTATAFAKSRIDTVEIAHDGSSKPAIVGDHNVPPTVVRITVSGCDRKWYIEDSNRITVIDGKYMIDGQLFWEWIEAQLPK